MQIQATHNSKTSSDYTEILNSLRVGLRQMFKFNLSNEGGSKT